LASMLGVEFFTRPEPTPERASSEGLRPDSSEARRGQQGFGLKEGKGCPPTPDLVCVWHGY